MQSIFDFTLKQLQNEVKPAFRAKQIYNWLYKQYATSYEDMKNIPKELKQSLQAGYSIAPLEILTKQKSTDGSIKY
ncbi:MAG: 23S rRNA (adenine(2503)-C(2))-methyltransferase RlmN, partial [Campylobacterota bacterium]|nr:23S rRNA (adenine(2503)-C(2))-methyltransferase RlmN [Campylobacterota bacterium]